MRVGWWCFGIDMDAFLWSTGVVALAEMGDKTQLLSLVLAARFKKPWPIIAGILVATLANHGVAGALGAWIADTLGAERLRWILGVSFVIMAAWMLVPDKLTEEDAPSGTRTGVFLTTLVVFFLAEIGDKTQFATIALAAQYPESLVVVVVGTTLGMMLANVPVVVFGQAITRRLPIRWIHTTAAVLFAGLGVVALVGW